MSKVAAYYHIVFCTKAREMTLPREHRDDMYRFMWKEIQKDLSDSRDGLQNTLQAQYLRNKKMQ